MGWANRMGQVGTWGEGEEIRPDQTRTWPGTNQTARRGTAPTG